MCNYETVNHGWTNILIFLYAEAKHYRHLIQRGLYKQFVSYTHIRFREGADGGVDPYRTQTGVVKICTLIEIISNYIITNRNNIPNEYVQYCFRRS
jgi:hypothetical protein